MKIGTIIYCPYLHIFRNIMFRILKQLRIQIKNILWKLNFKFRATCGHKSKQVAYGSLNKNLISAMMVMENNGTIPICHKCFIKLTIPCAWCGLPITPGEYITLFKSSDACNPSPGHMICGNRLVGCMREHCCRSSYDAIGMWVPTENFQSGCIEFVPT